MPIPLRPPLLAALLTLALPACTPLPFLSAQAELGAEPWRDARLGYVAQWQRLRSDGGLSVLERFARLVQHMIDDASARTGDPISPFAGLDPEQLFLDDLVDVFVPDEFRNQKELVMASAPTLVGQVIAEQTGDLSGFRADLQAGDGRFRHFAMNAAAAYRFPPFLVDAAARWMGGDLDDGRALSADSRADIASNEIGRDFAALLRSTSVADLAGGSAEQWLIERFGP
jgi:hypothetical protein